MWEENKKDPFLGEQWGMGVDGATYGMCECDVCALLC